MAQITAQGLPKTVHRWCPRPQHGQFRASRAAAACCLALQAVNIHTSWQHPSRQVTQKMHAMLQLPSKRMCSAPYPCSIARGRAYLCLSMLQVLQLPNIRVLSPYIFLYCKDRDTTAAEQFFLALGRPGEVSACS